MVGRRTTFHECAQINGWGDEIASNCSISIPPLPQAACSGPLAGADGLRSTRKQDGSRHGNKYDQRELAKAGIAQVREDACSADEPEIVRRREPQ